VLDNFEQLTAGTPTVATLLEQAPRVKLIVTSREPLHLSGEHVFPVPPLALPDQRRVADLGALARCDSVRLFVERARRVLPAFTLTSQNAAAVAELCVRLDGLPLALELAAARAPMLSPEAMLKRLGDRLKLLTGGARDVPERQQTLRNNLAWSHELLEAGERKLFARLGVFSGGFTLEAAESACDADIDTLASLLDRSVLRREGERFGMLETIREFAREQLLAGGEAEAVQERHAACFEALAERHHARRWHHAKEGLDELEREHDNLRAALDFLLSSNPARALRLAGALGWFWHQRSHYSEGRRRLAAVLAATSEPGEERARALAAAGELAAWSGDLASARPLIEEAVAIWRESGKKQEIAGALIELGWGCFYCGDAAALGLMEEGLALRQEVGDPILVNRARIGFLQVLVSTGDVDRVEPLAREALAVARQTRDLSSEHFAYHFLADCSLIRGDCAASLPLYQRALALAVELADRAETCAEIQGIAMSSAGLGQPAVALRLAGAAAAEFDALAIDLSGIAFWHALLERYLGRARAAMSADAAAAAWEEGRRTWFEHATALALGVDSSPGVATASG
jgi:predicted ATPase